jgi:hypothetical protein
MSNLFPIPYDHWYAAVLFLGAGHDRAAVRARVGLDEEAWTAVHRLYGNLHYSGTSWVEGVFHRHGRPDPEDDPEILGLLMAGADTVIADADLGHGLRHALRSLRLQVEAHPHIGPFADVTWKAFYICERRFPPVRYVHDGNRVFAGDQPLHDRKGTAIEGVDPLSFRKLGERWFRDANRVYCQGETPTMRFWFVVRKADPDTFTVYNERYAADKAASYYSTGSRHPTTEPGTFEIVGYQYDRGQKPGFHVDESHFARDNHCVYAYGKVLEGADAPSFHAIGNEGVYFADKNRIYHENKPIADADRGSFTCAPGFGQYWAYDRNRPYSRGVARSVSEEFDDWDKYFEAHPEISGSWWHREKERRKAKPKTASEFTPLGGPYWSDGERVFARQIRHSGSPMVSLDHFDLATFRHIVDAFAEDRSGLRYLLASNETYARPPVKGADPKSFSALGDGWYADRKQVYFLNDRHLFPELKIVKVDHTSFRPIGGAYAVDRDGLIFEGIRKRGVEGFAEAVGLGGRYARIGQTILYRGKPLTKIGALDIATARGVEDDLLLDANGAMLFDSRFRKPIPGLDPATFRFITWSYAVDKARVYGRMDTALRVCEIADRDSVEPNNFWSIRDRYGVIGRTRDGAGFVRDDPQPE